MNKRKQKNIENAKLALKYRLYSRPDWLLKDKLECIAQTGEVPVHSITKMESLLVVQSGRLRAT